MRTWVRLGAHGVGGESARNAGDPKGEGRSPSNPSLTAKSKSPLTGAF
jgi:hypothetical protein